MGGWKFSDHNSPPMLLTTLLIVMALSKKKVEKLWGNTPSEKIIYIGNLSSNFPTNPTSASSCVNGHANSTPVQPCATCMRQGKGTWAALSQKFLPRFLTTIHTWDTRPISDLTHSRNAPGQNEKNEKQHASSLSDTLWSIYLSIFLSILSYLILSELILSYVSKSREKSYGNNQHTQHPSAA